MKATVVYKFNNIFKFKLEDGRIIKMTQAEVNSVNKLLAYGDSGEFYTLPNGKTKFKLDTVNGELTPPALPDIIHIPTQELDIQ